MGIFFFSNYTYAQEKKHIAWEVTSDKGETAYLVGSVHIVKPELYPLDDLYYELLDKSDLVAFEVNLDSMMIESQALLPKYGLYPMGETLKDHLPDETFKKLDKELNSLGVPLAMMMQMKPWIIASSLTALQLQQKGYSAAGIDQHFFNKAKEAGKPVWGLETTELQMQIFDNMSDQEQVEFLEYTLDHSAESVQAIDKMMESWSKGDAEAINEFVSGGMEDFSEEVYFEIFEQRNQNWVPQIEKMMKEGKTPLIIVGTGHLVGEKSVNDLMQKKGYSVKQL